jgi:hypothetical protein
VREKKMLPSPKIIRRRSKRLRPAELPFVVGGALRLRRSKRNRS